MFNSHSKTIYIYAPNVRSYGGRTLIQSLVDLNDNNMVFILNQHLKLNRAPHQLVLADGSLIKQLQYEIKLRRELDKEHIVLCLGNKPPFIRLPCMTVTGLFSVFSIDIPPSVPLSFSRHIKSRIQIALNILLKRNTDAFLARSIEMVDICKAKTNKDTIYFPFVTNDKPLDRSYDNPRPKKKRALFFYPADALPHKNLSNTLSAWEILRSRNIDAHLTVTVTDKELDNLSNSKPRTNIKAVGFLDEQALSEHFLKSDALLFPSLMESFPLPIIEARHHKLPVVASERTFIREQIDPEETFDPLSSISIADAVQRMMGIYDDHSERPTIRELPRLLRDQQRITNLDT